MNFEKIDIIVSEIDGIITNDIKPIDHMNYTMFKNYCDRDFEAINELKKFFTFVFLASDPDVSYNVMRTRNIPAYFVKEKENKDAMLSKIMSRYNMIPENLLYLGSRLSDVHNMTYAEISFTTLKTNTKLKQAAKVILTSPPGHGVISEVCDILYPEMERRKRKS